MADDEVLKRRDLTRSGAFGSDSPTRPLGFVFSLNISENTVIGRRINLNMALNIVLLLFILIANAIDNGCDFIVHVTKAGILGTLHFARSTILTTYAWMKTVATDIKKLDAATVREQAVSWLHNCYNQATKLRSNAYDILLLVSSLVLQIISVAAIVLFGVVCLQHMCGALFRSDERAMWINIVVVPIATTAVLCKTIEPLARGNATIKLQALNGFKGAANQAFVAAMLVVCCLLLAWRARVIFHSAESITFAPERTAAYDAMLEYGEREALRNVLARRPYRQLSEL